MDTFANRVFTVLMLLAVIGFSSQAQQASKMEKWESASFFRGFCISDWDNQGDDLVSRDDFISLKATGANLVVIQTGGFHAVDSPYGWQAWDVYEGDTTYWYELLDTMVGYAREAELHYVIGVRSGPGRVDVAEDEGASTVWTNVTEQQLYGSMLREMVSRYLPDTLFVGLDLTVEPNPRGDLAGESVEDLRAALLADGIDMNAINRLWIDSVRIVDSSLPLLVQTVHWSNPAYFSLMTSQPDPYVIYKAHCYNPYDLSHAETAFSVQYPDSFFSNALQAETRFDRAHLESSEYAPVIQFQQTHAVPMMIGEFGIQHPQQGGEQYLSDIMTIAEDHGWHYSLWNWNNTATFRYPHFDDVHGTAYMDTVEAHFRRIVTGIREETQANLLPVGIGDVHSYPNPFSNATTISVTLRAAGYIHLDIHDLLGRRVRTLANDHISRGTFHATWDGRNDAGQRQPPGLYLCTLSSAGQAGTILLLRQ